MPEVKLHSLLTYTKALANLRVGKTLHTTKGNICRLDADSIAEYKAMLDGCVTQSEESKRTPIIGMFAVLA